MEVRRSLSTLAKGRLSNLPKVDSKRPDLNMEMPRFVAACNRLLSMLNRAQRRLQCTKRASRWLRFPCAALRADAPRNKHDSYPLMAVS